MSRKVVGSGPDGVIGIFHWLNPLSCTVVLGCTQPQTEMSTWGLWWGGKGIRCVGVTTLPPSCADCLKIMGTSTFCTRKGLTRSVMG